MFGCFLRLAVLVLTEATPLALNIAHPNTLTAVPQIRNSTDSLIQSFNAASVECDGHEYGHDLQDDSCDDVANHQLIPLGPQTFAPRGGPAHPTYPTPTAYASKDGLCILEVFQTNSQTIIEDTRIIKVAANLMLEQCVRRGGGQGGIAWGLGRSGQLGVVMRSHRPSVNCGATLTPSLSVPDSFAFLANSFPATTNLQVFGIAPPSHGIDVTLPWEMLCPFHPPAMKAVDAIVRTTGGKDRSSWYDIYIALITTWSICGVTGRGGIARNLGEAGRLTIELREVAYPNGAASSA